MKITSTEVKKIHFVRLNPGDDILLSLREAVSKIGIQTGFIANGLGSVQSYHYHVVADKNLPPAELFPKAEEPRDVVTITGPIIDGRVHAHIVLSDDKKAEGGHLEEGSRVLTFTLVAIMEFEDVSFTNWDAINEQF